MIFLMSYRCVRTRSFFCIFWWPFHSLLLSYHKGMGGRLPFPFLTAAIQNSPLFSRPWTPTSAILEGERTYSLFEKNRGHHARTLPSSLPNIFKHFPSICTDYFYLKGDSFFLRWTLVSLIKSLPPSSNIVTCKLSLNLFSSLSLSTGSLLLFLK